MADPTVAGFGHRFAGIPSAVILGVDTLSFSGVSTVSSSVGVPKYNWDQCLMANGLDSFYVLCCMLLIVVFGP